MKKTPPQDPIPQLGLFSPEALAAARLRSAVDLQAPASTPASEPEPVTTPPAAPPPAALVVPAPPFAAPPSGFPATALYVDAPALLEVCGHAPKLRESRSHRGAPNGQIRGFTKTLLRLLGDFAPAVVAIVFDMPDNSGFVRRRKRVPTYHESRTQPSPQDEVQEVICQQIAQCLGCRVILSYAAEPRDVLGTLVSRTPEDWDAIVCTARTSLLELGQRETCRFSWWRTGMQETNQARVECRRRLQIEPAQVPLYLALSGAAEGLPGLAGIGEATARALVTEFKNAAALFETMALGLPDLLLRIVGSAQIRNGQRVARTLLENQDVLRTLMEVATTDRDVQDAPEVPELEDLSEHLLRQTPDAEELRSLGSAWSINDLSREDETPQEDPA